MRFLIYLQVAFFIFISIGKASETTTAQSSQPLEPSHSSRAADSSCSSFLQLESNSADAAQNPKTQEALLTALSKTLNLSKQNPLDLENDEEWADALSNALVEQSVLLSEEHRLAFRTAYRLKRLFESGIIQRAVSEAFALYGYKTQKKVSILFEGFSAIEPKDQIALVDSIFEHLMFWIEDSVGTKNLSQTAAFAKTFNMSLSEYSAFIQEWKRHQKSNYQEVKLAILMKILEANPSFVMHVRKNRAWHKLIWRYFFPGAVRPLPKMIQQKVSVESLALDESESYGSDDLLKSFSRGGLSWKEYFLKTQYRQLSRGQIKEILKNYRSVLSREVLEILDKRVNDLSQLAISIEAVQKKSSELESLKEIMQTWRNNNPLTYDEVNSLLRTVDGFAFPDDILSELKSFFMRNKGRFTVEVFVYFAEGVYRFISAFAFPDDSIAGIRFIQKAARSFVLNQRQASKLKTLAQGIVKQFVFPDDTAAGLRIIDGQWGKNIDVFKGVDVNSMSDVQRAIDEAQTQVSELNERQKIWAQTCRGV